MIRKLQKRFIRISVVALSVAIVLVVIIVNLANWISVKNELKTTLDFISEGAYSELDMEMPDMPDGKDDFKGENDRFRDSPMRMSQRFPQITNRHERIMVAQASWYSISYDAERNQCELLSFNAMDEDTDAISERALAVLNNGNETGISGEYMYKLVSNDDGGSTVYLLNCETRLSATNKLILISAIACVGAIIITFLVVSLASRRAVAPTIKNMEQQKQFITNASHELKTPLTVISTNMELLDMEIPDNNWVNATKKQTAVMRHLVDELVYLSRMEEENAPLTMESVDLKALMEEVAEPFEAMAEYSGRELNVDMDDNLRATCDRMSVQRLFSTLCDNAMKYASGEGAVNISGKTEGKYAVIEISNEVDKPLNREQCERLFDRFYRADPSRSKGKQSGFGIGLAIARAIAEKHNGSISAKMIAPNRLSLICRLPVK